MSKAPVEGTGGALKATQGLCGSAEPVNIRPSAKDTAGSAEPTALSGCHGVKAYNVVVGM